MPAGRVEPMRLPGGARALFTSRAEGNLSTVVGPDAGRGARAREELSRGLGLRRLAHVRQVHGTTVLPVSDEGIDATADATADGLVTSECGVGAMVLVADCVPVALANDEAVAVVHAGWRGLAAGVLAEGVRALRAVDSASEIAAAIGPCAGVCCYEVGEEVHAAFAGAHRHGRHLDLRGIAHERLRGEGVEAIDDVSACTICSVELFSHRREGRAAGRQACVVWREVATPDSD